MMKVTIPLDSPTRSNRSYSILYTSTHVYRMQGYSSPTRVIIWNNRKRPNPQRVTRYLDPARRPTNDIWSAFFTPESTVIDAHGKGTGTPESGQVWAPGSPLMDGDEIELAYPDGTFETGTLHMMNNGHGYLIWTL